MVLNKKIILVILLIISIFLGIKFIAQFFSKSAVENALGPNAKVNIGDGSSSLKMPSDFPSDIPIYQNGKLTSSLQTSGARPETAVAFQYNKDQYAKITDFYKSKLEIEGWNIKNISETQGIFMLNASKDSRDLQVIIGIQGDSLVLGLSYK